MIAEPETTLDKIAKLATAPVEDCTIIINYGEDRHQELIPPSEVWRNDVEIFVRCDLRGPGDQPIAIKDVHSVSLRLAGEDFLDIPLDHPHQLPFGIKLTLAVSEPEIGWAIGKKD